MVEVVIATGIAAMLVVAVIDGLMNPDDMLRAARAAAAQRHFMASQARVIDNRMIAEQVRR
jgi:hypothetical protein